MGIDDYIAIWASIGIVGAIAALNAFFSPAIALEGSMIVTGGVIALLIV